MAEREAKLDEIYDKCTESGLTTVQGMLQIGALDGLSFSVCDNQHMQQFNGVILNGKLCLTWDYASRREIEAVITDTSLFHMVVVDFIGFNLVDLNHVIQVRM